MNIHSREHAAVNRRVVGSSPTWGAMPEQSSLCSGLFLPLAENKPSARSCLPSCGTRLWSRRINRLANRRPLRQQILAVSRAAGARICCQLFAGLKFVSCFLSIICFFNAFHIGGEFVFFYRIQYLQHDYVLFKDIFCFLQLTAYTPPVKKQALKALKHIFLFY